MVEPAITEAIASGRVPPHITAEYLMENQDDRAIMAIVAVGAVTALIVMLRCISRFFLARRYGIDDALAQISLVFQIAFIALSIVNIRLGCGRHIQYLKYVMSEERLVKTEELDFAAHLIYTSALFICRCSGLAFYSRLCELHYALSTAIRITGVFLVAAYLAQMLLIVCHCLPVTALWPYSFQQHSENFVCLAWGVVYVTNSALSVVCDVLMLLLPGILIRILQISTKRKLQLYLVLLPGFLVLFISIIRLYLVVEGQWQADGSWEYDIMIIIENSEIGATLVALSIPGLKPVFSLLKFKITGTPPSGYYASNHSPSPSSANRAASPWKTSTGSRPRRSLFRRDSLLELGEGATWATYEVNIEAQNDIAQFPPAPGTADKGQAREKKPSWPLDSWE